MERRENRTAGEDRVSGPRSTRPLRRRRSDFQLNVHIPPECPLFVADAAFREIVSVRVYGRNAAIARQGDPVRCAYVLRKGLVQISNLMPNGKTFVDLMGPGSVFGVAGLLTEQPHGFGLSALDECEFDLADATRFLAYLKENPAAAIELIRQLCRQETQLLRHMLLLTVKAASSERLLSALHELSGICGEPGEAGTRITVPLTIQTLADRIGCSRQWVSRLMGQLEAQGKLRRKGAWITLIDGAEPSARS